MVFSEEEEEEEERKNMERLRKLKERAPTQIKGMVASIIDIRSKVSSDAIDCALAELASVCQTDTELSKQVSPHSIHNENRMNKNAKLSDDRTYRYDLSRVWDGSKPYAMFICLNPSTADESEDDPTSRKCIQYAKSWGYGGMHIANLFAYRATEPKDLLDIDDPVGEDNDKWLSKIANDADIVIAAWGNHGQYLNRADQVSNSIPTLHCLNVNNSGEPAHPLYLSADLKPAPYRRIDYYDHIYKLSEKKAMSKELVLSDTDSNNFNKIIKEIKRWCDKNQLAVGVGEMAVGASLIAWGVHNGVIEMGSQLVATQLGGANAESLVGAIGGSGIGAVAGSILGSIGVAGMGGAIGIPAVLVIGGASVVLGMAGYTAGDISHNVENMPVDIESLAVNGSLLLIGLSLIIDGARRSINDESVLAALSKYKENVIYMKGITANIVAKTNDELNGFIDELKKLPEDTIDSSATAGSAGAVNYGHP